MSGGGGWVSFFGTPAGIALLSVASLAATALVAYLPARAGYRLMAAVASPVRRLSGLVVPEGPAGVLAVTFLLATAIVFGVAAPVPDRVGTLGDGDGAGSETAGGFLDRAFDDEDGVVRAEDGTVDLSATGYDRPEPDTAGDRLADGWLRAGETPDGAPLENGSVARLDPYVYVVNGTDVEPLSDRERRQLRDVWAEMPVENPDGSTDVDIHVESGDSVGEPVRFGVGDDDHTTYYTGDVMGPRHYRYHLVVLGEPTSDVRGWGAAPGYSSFVTGVRHPDYDGAVTNGVRVMTHELLHTVVGTIDAGSSNRRLHTSRGWLGGDEFLASPTADRLNETRLRGSGFYQDEICGSGDAGGEE